jgi:hypothetical protein
MLGARACVRPPQPASARPSHGCRHTATMATTATAAGGPTARCACTRASASPAYASGTPVRGRGGGVRSHECAVAHCSGAPANPHPTGWSGSGRPSCRSYQDACLDSEDCCGSLLCLGLPGYPHAVCECARGVCVKHPSNCLCGGHTCGSRPWPRLPVRCAAGAHRPPPPPPQPNGEQ